MAEETKGSDQATVSCSVCGHENLAADACVRCGSYPPETAGDRDGPRAAFRFYRGPENRGVLVTTLVVAWAFLGAGIILAAGLWWREGTPPRGLLALLGGILLWAFFCWCYAALQNLVEIRQNSGALLQAFKQLGSGPFYETLEQAQKHQTRLLREIMARLRVKEQALQELEERMGLELKDKERLRDRLEAEKQGLRETLHRIQLKEEEQLRARLKQQAEELGAGAGETTSQS